MSLDFLNNLKENLSKNETLSNLADGIQDFITEVSDRLNNSNEELDIVSKITSERKSSLASENSIMKARDETLKEYAKNTMEKGDLYFVFNKVKGTDDYRVIQMSENTDKTVTINSKDLPTNCELNQVMRLNNGKLEVDAVGTEEVLNTIYKKADDILDRQDKKLRDYRQEGHIYTVTEDNNNRIFLWDTTAKPDFEIEEVNFPKDLLQEAKEGSKFIYTNGNYEKVN